MTQVYQSVIVEQLSFGLGFGFDGLGLDLSLDLGELSVLGVFGRGSLFGVLGGLSLAGLKLVHASGGVDKLLLTGVERMAVRANFHVDALHGRMSREGGVATVAVDGGLKYLRVDGGFHNSKIVPYIRARVNA
jgi:hypothetical protein